MFFIINCVFISCTRNKPFEDSINKLVDKDRPYDISLLSALKEEGLKIVPALIKQIDKNEKGIFGQCYTWESDLTPLISYVGVRAAYMIEFLLYDTSEIKEVCHRRSIVKRDKNGIYAFDLINHDDMIQIKKIYKKWWENNKMKSIAELQKEYKTKRILDGYDYFWR